jgi:gamma-glutamylputrescine oxidase
MLSFWERESLIKYDFVVIGSGIVGLSTAISLKNKNPQASVLVLERGILPTGASTKNAGFACFGSVTELLSDIEIMGEDKCLQLVEKRWKGLLNLRKLLSDTKIGYEPTGGNEVITEKELYAIDKIAYINQLVKPIFKEDIYSENKNAKSTYGFNETVVKTMIFNKHEALINTGEMVKNLLKLAYSKEITVLTGVNVVAIEDNENIVKIKTKNITFEAKKVAVCTNAFTKSLYPELEIKPGRGQVLITKPIKELKVKGQFHMDEGYYYFRNVGDRILFGGGRNLDFKKEETTEFSLNEMILNTLEDKLKNIILPNLEYEIDMKWTGIMAFGTEKVPILKKHSQNIALGVRMGGMGVAIGSLVGEELAELLIKQ